MGLRPTGADGELPADPGELVLTVDAGDPPRMLLGLEPVAPAAPAASDCCLSAGAVLCATIFA